jgi:hypothetical protein
MMGQSALLVLKALSGMLPANLVIHVQPLLLMTVTPKNVFVQLPLLTSKTTNVSLVQLNKFIILILNNAKVAQPTHLFSLMVNALHVLLTLSIMQLQSNV